MTSQTEPVMNKKGMIPWYVYFAGAAIYTALAGWMFAESSPLHGCASSAHRWGFSMPGEPGNKRNKA
jgi:hypothetical protein